MAGLAFGGKPVVFNSSFIVNTRVLRQVHPLYFDCSYYRCSHPQQMCRYCWLGESAAVFDSCRSLIVVVFSVMFLCVNQLIVTIFRSTQLE
jgi:hypothetical protein